MSTKPSIVGTLILSLTGAAACGDGDATDVGTAGSDTTGTDTTDTTDTTSTTATDTGVDIDDDCVSDSFWTDGDLGSERMYPGRDCLSCHQDPNAFPGLVLAGTVYTNPHELDDCQGVQGVTVTITDATGTEFQCVTNLAGNFELFNVMVVPPYSARLDWHGRSREMVGMQTSTACNSCHTVGGSNNAPGRIRAP